ncbi:acyltransferase [Microbacterium terricola]|uniref:Acyltransferase n=1 Tax=Microbacterium terricola TaxID=344163 RepID=A0ABM8DWQ4_9MICO|nr:acyltransferase [Microbacterium terricola]
MDRPRKTSSFRPDIQGLRAVAVGTVLLFHANLSLFRGGFVGVDIFFVISGFLITGILLREAQSTGRIRLGDFYAKRARRILPAATVVLLVTLALTVLILPQIRWESIGIEAIASALYVVNWVFAAGTDYLNAEVAASPLQHFWTLAVEEQFYIVWPLVLVVLLALLRRKARSGTLSDRGAGAVRAARVGVLMILVPSLLYSISYTAIDPAPAYFVTTTRLWELAIGAALAVFAAQVARIPHWLGHTLGWAGLAAIVAATLLFSHSTPFPGYAALVPTLGAAAIIAAGMNGRAEVGVGRLLTLKPMRWIGDISYSLYLWHWPLLVVGTFLLGGELRARYGLLIVAFAVLPAWLSYRFIEKPFQNWPWLKRSVRRSLLGGVSLMAVTVVCASLVYVTPGKLNPEYDTAGTTQKLGAEALTDDFANDDLATFTDAGKPVDKVEGGFTPSAINARKDNTVVYALDCHLGSPEATPKIDGCIFGDPEGDVSVVLIGDSHAANWAPPYIALAEKYGWRLRITTKASCGFSGSSQADANGGEYTTCNEWSATSFDQILEESPDLLITANRFTRAAWPVEPTREKARLAYADDLHDNLQRMNDAGIATLVMNATPRMTTDVPECMSANPGHLTACATPREDAFGPGSGYVKRTVKGLSDADVIDMSNWVCPDADACAAVVGHVVVWRDSAHFTETYARTLAEPLEAKLRQSDLARSVLW